MAALTTLANLLDGVGEFPKVSLHMLESMLPGEDLDKGLSSALTSYHNSAWERCQNDFSLKGVDVSNTDALSDDDKTLIKAACCFEILSQLHFRNATSKEDFHFTEAERCHKEFDRIIGRCVVLMPGGQSGRLGQSIPVYRC
jgi:hypothetical protein